MKIIKNKKTDAIYISSTLIYRKEDNKFYDSDNNLIFYAYDWQEINMKQQ